MSEKVEQKTAEVQEPAKPSDGKSYPWLGLSHREFCAMDPANLPPMLRKAHRKHQKAAQAGKGK